MKTESDRIYQMRKKFFNDHADTWLNIWYKDTVTGHYDKHKKDFERLFSLLPLKHGDTVVDVGCGTGVLVPYILEATNFAGTLYEVDFAERMIEVNKRLNNREGIHFIVSDAEDIPLEDNACDVVICFSCFPHFHDKEKTLSTLSRILKPCGTFAMSHFDSSEGINKHHGTCHAVMHDLLPDTVSMRTLLATAGMHISLFIDEPGFYCIIADKQSL